MFKGFIIDDGDEDGGDKNPPVLFVEVQREDARNWLVEYFAYWQTLVLNEAFCIGSKDMLKAPEKDKKLESIRPRLLRRFYSYVLETLPLGVVH